MTWKEAWKRGAQSLQKAGVEEYDLDAWYLLEHVTGITKASYYMEPEHPMHDQEEREYLELIRKRSTRIPLQHLTGVQEFMGLEFLDGGELLRQLVGADRDGHVDFMRFQFLLVAAVEPDAAFGLP